MTRANSRNMRNFLNQEFDDNFRRGRTNLGGKLSSVTGAIGSTTTVLSGDEHRIRKFIISGRITSAVQLRLTIDNVARIYYYLDTAFIGPLILNLDEFFVTGQTVAIQILAGSGTIYYTVLYEIVGDDSTEYPGT